MSIPQDVELDKKDASSPRAVALTLEDGQPLTDYVPGTDEEKRLVRKLDARILPILWVMYVCNSIDRSNIGNAKVGGMSEDLKLSSSDYSLAVAIFFVGYLIFEVPSNMILSRSRPSIYLPGLMFVWGCITLAMHGVNSKGGLIAYRIALGIAEAGFYPGVTFLLSCWYTPKEISKRVAIWYSAQYVAGAFSGILAGIVINSLEGKAGTPGWKWLFIIEGILTTVLSIVAYFVLPNFPQNTKWLNEEEKRLAIHRLIVREEDDLAEVSHRRAFIQAVTDLKVWLFLLVDSVLASFGTVSYFYPTIVSSLGYKGRQAQFMTVPIYIVILVVAIIMGWSADRTGQKAYHVMASCTWGVIAFSLCVGIQNNALKYTMICLGSAGLWSVYPVFFSWLVTMFEGRERRAISIAFINGIANLSAIYGSYFWPDSDSPRYVMGFSITISFMAFGVVCVGFLKYKYGDKGVGKAQRT